MKIRLSYGTAVKMGLHRGKMLAEPTTAYVMLGEKCESNCAFCAQRRDSRKENYLSRIIWPEYPVEVLKEIKGFSRICFQTLDYEEVVDDLLAILPIIPYIPVSVSIVPIPREDIVKLKNAGVQIISIALDAANEEIFTRVKGSGVSNRFTWKGHWNALRDAVSIFGTANTHLIVGLGESDEDLVDVMLYLKKENITTALFSFTPVQGGAQPDVGRYRAIQLARFLIYRGYEDFLELADGKISKIRVPEREKESVERGLPFLTSGCPGCNRPFYNERPGGVIYNYPRKMYEKEIKEALEQLRNYSKLVF